MRKIFFSVIIIFAAVFAMPQINTYAASSELSVGFTADENGVNLNWSVSGKGSIKQSTVFRYDTESKKYIIIARTDKTEYTDVVNINPEKSIRYKILVTLDYGKNLSKTIKCYAELPEIPAYYDSEIYYEGEICRSYVYAGKTKKDGKYPVIYHNYFGDKVIGEIEDKYTFEYCAVSADGRICYYMVDDKVYRYSDTDGKNEMIFKSDDYLDIITSDSGEYCAIINLFSYNKKIPVWHEGKLSFVRPPEGRIFSIEAVNDEGKLIYSALYDDYAKDEYYYCLYEFDFNTGKSTRFARLECSEKYAYFTEIYPEKGTYISYGSSFGVYSGKIGSEPKLIFSADEFYGDSYITSNGEITIVSDNEYFYVIDNKSGKRSVLANVFPEPFAGGFDRDIYDYFVCSDDLDAVMYIDYEKKCIVRLSEWDSDKFSYSKRQKIKFDTSENLCIAYTSNNFNIVLFTEHDEKGDISDYWIAFFQNGTFENEKNTDLHIWGSDAYDRMFCYGSWEKNNATRDNVYKDLLILNPDGSTTVIYDGYYNRLSGDQYSICLIYFTEYSFYQEVGYELSDSSDIYYVDKNGNVIFYMHEDYDNIIIFD